MPHEYGYLNDCQVECLQTMLRYQQDKLSNAIENHAHATRTGNRHLIEHYREWEELLRCMIGEISWHIAKHQA